jgi:hypothetical protein
MSFSDFIIDCQYTRNVILTAEFRTFGFNNNNNADPSGRSV